MTERFRHVPPLVLAGLFLAAAPAVARDNGENWSRCRDESPARQDEAVIGACSALLETGQLSGGERALALSHRARAHVRRGDYRRAAPDFREAARNAPGDPSIANGLCWSLAVLGEDLDGARAACDASLRDRPDAPDALDSRGLVALKQSRFQDAWNDYDAAVRIEPNGISWLYGRGIAALRLGRTAEGRADLARAEAMYPAIAGMYAGYGIRP